MASIDWDTEASDGGNTLESPRPDPANRFFDWEPDVVVIGQRRTAASDAEQYLVKFRTDYIVRVTIRHLTPSLLTDALALKKWLIEGGEVTLTTDDAVGATFDELTLRQETEPEITNEDDNRQHFSFTCELRSADPIVIDYSASA